MLKRLVLLLTMFSLFFMFSCSNENDEVFNPSPYELVIPINLPRPSLPDDNPLTNEGVILGKTLFMEKKLSADGTQACVSCHNREDALTDNKKAFSVGIRGLEGKRNSMPIFNMFYHSNKFFWDGRADLLRDQALMPIQDPLEMDHSLEGAVATIAGIDEYRTLFKEAFGDDLVTSERIALALEQFMLSLVSGNSKWDRVQRGETTFNDSEQRGHDLFFEEHEENSEIKGADCFHCHSGPNFMNNEYMNNGLDDNPSDHGLAEVTGNSWDIGKFKVPSLRNIEYSGPYMHDGRFESLEQVLQHYNKGVKDSPNLDPNMHSALEGLKLSDQDIQDLINFLKTLSDDEFINGEF